MFGKKKEEKISKTYVVRAKVNDRELKVIVTADNELDAVAKAEGNETLQMMKKTGSTVIVIGVDK